MRKGVATTVRGLGFAASLAIAPAATAHNSDPTPKVDPTQDVLVDCSAFQKGAAAEWQVLKPTTVFSDMSEGPIKRTGLAPGFAVATIQANGVSLASVLAKKCG